VPDAKFQYLYQTALRTLTLLTAENVVPGPFTYKRFWFRDACLMLQAMFCIGLEERARQSMESFLPRQKLSGYFQSQEGEWDSNGQVLWLADRSRQLTGQGLGPNWIEALGKAADWIERKRLTDSEAPLHQGLLPAGFSAEHLGPNDYYYWDNFWSLTGLEAASRIFSFQGRPDRAQHYAAAGASLRGSIRSSLDRIPDQRKQGALPASPYRRLDSGAIGSLVTDYPLGLTSPEDPEVGATAEYLAQNCLLHGGFFQDMIHSGINPYLSLSLAQTFLRRGDQRFQTIIQSVADLASPTGQWPEAIHPQTRGGCMGDGQHGWAAAEWVMAIKNLFVREEKDRLVLGSGLFPRWLEAGTPLGLGPVLTPYGRVSLEFRPRQQRLEAEIRAEWQDEGPLLELCVPGFEPQTVLGPEQTVVLTPEQS
jgi:hypothetical protein